MDDLDIDVSLESVKELAKENKELKDHIKSLYRTINILMRNMETPPNDNPDMDADD